MRIFFTFLFPFVLQIIAYILVFAAAQGGGSFMGLFAIPVSAVAIITLLIYGLSAAKNTQPLFFSSLISVAIALLPPIFLLILRAMGV